VLSLEDARLTGEIPSEFGTLTNLEILLLLSNYLEGTIPSELGNLAANLRKISFSLWISQLVWHISSPNISAVSAHQVSSKSSAISSLAVCPRSSALPPPTSTTIAPSNVIAAYTRIVATSVLSSSYLPEIWSTSRGMSTYICKEIGVCVTNHNELLASSDCAYS
jgi:hypothetical protein